MKKDTTKELYESLMYKIAKTVKRIIEEADIEIPENTEDSVEYEVKDAVKEVLSQLEQADGAFLDWGAVNDMDKNVNSKKIADMVGQKFQDKGYFVYYQGMGDGSETIYPGTPVCLRINKRPHVLDKYDQEFN